MGRDHDVRGDTRDFRDRTLHVPRAVSRRSTRGRTSIPDGGLATFVVLAIAARLHFARQFYDVAGIAKASHGTGRRTVINGCDASAGAT